MTLSQRKIIDADGHIAEDAQAIIAHMPEAYREKARVQPFNPFPPFDHLHAGHLVDMFAHSHKHLGNVVYLRQRGYYAVLSIDSRLGHRTAV